MNIPIDINKMNGLLLPQASLHLSLTEPINGDIKNPRSGEKTHAIVICSWLKPISRRIGEANAVSAEYANSMPIMINESLIKSIRDLSL